MSEEPRWGRESGCHAFWSGPLRIGVATWLPLVCKGNRRYGNKYYWMLKVNGKEMRGFSKNLGEAKRAVEEMFRREGNG